MNAPAIHAAQANAFASPKGDDNLDGVVGAEVVEYQ